MPVNFAQVLYVCAGNLDCAEACYCHEGNDGEVPAAYGSLAVNTGKYFAEMLSAQAVAFMAGFLLRGLNAECYVGVNSFVFRPGEEPSAGRKVEGYGAGFAAKTFKVLAEAQDVVARRVKYSVFCEVREEAAQCSAVEGFGFL